MKKPTLTQIVHGLGKDIPERRPDSRRYYRARDGRRYRRAFTPIGTIVDREVFEACQPRSRRKGEGFAKLSQKRRKAGRR